MAEVTIDGRTFVSDGDSYLEMAFEQGVVVKVQTEKFVWERKPRTCKETTNKEGEG